VKKLTRQLGKDTMTVTVAFVFAFFMPSTVLAVLSISLLYWYEYLPMRLPHIQKKCILKSQAVKNLK